MIKSFRRQLNGWGPPLLWMVAIFWFSSQPQLPALHDSLLDLLLKKGLHMTAYAILTGLLYRGAKLNNASTRSALQLALLTALLYAASDEWHQSFVPYRHGTAEDVLIDSVGITLMTAGLWQWHRSLPRHHRHQTSSG